MGARLPIVYVRGFAGGQGAIDAAADDPFYGLNEGSVHVRVGANGTPRFHQYEGPLIRLIKDQGYEVRIEGSQQQVLLDAEPNTLRTDSVWIYRFYDAAAGTFGTPPEPYDIQAAAQGVVDFIELVREKTAGRPPVYLVAHSMGGLICRTALQANYANPRDSVSKLCTIGTPHGGIDPKLGGPIGGWILNTFGPQGSRIFAPEFMREYLYPADAPGPANGDTRRLSGAFTPDRVLSIVGTNARDYDVALGLSSALMGVQSDGLVAIRNAYVVGSARAYVHRSHSGRYGLVNSEEVYQNLKRFLFGTLRVEIGLRGLAFEDTRVWQAEVRLAIRKLPVLIHEQTADHYCPVDLNAEAKHIPTPMSPVPLITVFLIPNPQNVARYALDITLLSLEERGGIFGFGEHLEQIGDWQDSLIVEVVLSESGALTRILWEWNSTLTERPGMAELSNTLDWATGRSADGSWHPVIPLPNVAARLLGDEAGLALTVTHWT